MLAEKVAIVTGASRGIGRATALKLTRNGAAILLVARTVEFCKSIAASIQREGGRAEAAACDVSRYTDVERLVADMQEAIHDSGMSEISKLPREQLADPHEPARAIAWLCTDEAADPAGEKLSIQDPVFRPRAGLEE